VLTAPFTNLFDFPSPDYITRGREAGEFQSQALVLEQKLKSCMGLKLQESRRPPVIKRAVSDAQSVITACSDYTSKNGSNEYYPRFNRVLGEFDVDKSRPSQS
jgi:hypothetical protein